MVGQQILDLPIGVRIPGGQPKFSFSTACIQTLQNDSAMLKTVASATKEAETFLFPWCLALNDTCVVFR